MQTISTTITIITALMVEVVLGAIMK